MAQPNRATKRAIKGAVKKKGAPRKAPSRTRTAVEKETAAVRAAREQREADVQAMEVTSASEWKKDSAGTKLALPSGKVCLAKNVGINPFLEGGLIPNDLLPIVMDALEEGKTGKARPKKDLDVAELLKHPEMLAQMTRLTDVVVLRSVLQPEVLDNQDDEGKNIPVSQRDPDALYIDEVDLLDKQFIFQWAVGGTSDLAAFRDEQTSAVAAMAAGASVGSEA